MNFEQTINEEMKNAMKSGDKLRLETMRSIRAAILEFKTSGIDREMNDDDGIKMLQHAAKQRKDAADMFKQAGRNDLYDKEMSELSILNEFLPKKLSEEEIIKVIDGIIAESGAKRYERFRQSDGTFYESIGRKSRRL